MPSTDPSAPVAEMADKLLSRARRFESAIRELKFDHRHHQTMALESIQVRPPGSPVQSSASVLQQERLRALGQMASGMAHQINNSLTPIIGFSDFLLDPSSGLPEDTKRYLECIRAAAADIALLVEQVRQFYRKRDCYEALEPLDLNTILRQITEVAHQRSRELFEKHGCCIHIETELDDALPAILESEKEVIEAVQHLVRNALEAMPLGGSLLIKTRCLETASGASNGAGLRSAVEVHDTGLGMDETTKQRCLEPFYSNKKPRGNGLGLSMVYGLMRRHQGSLEIDSQIGCGTTVRLLFVPVGSASCSDPECESGERAGWRIRTLADQTR